MMDADPNTASLCIRRLFASRFTGLSREDLEKDAKSRLQEHLQGLGQPVPEYVLVGSTGKSPNQIFEVECRSAQLDAAVKAKGSSIRRAEQSAATIALAELGVTP